MSTVPDSLAAVPAKTPRTERGRKTRRKLLDAATVEFGEKGFHDASISGITRRAGTALGSFYTYFDSKDEIFQALVHDLSSRVKEHAAAAVDQAADTLTREREALTAFLEFAREHKEIYRIIDESEFVDPESYRTHYENTAQRILERLRAGGDAGDIRPDLDEPYAWAVMGMNVFLGLKYAIWSDDRPAREIADIASDILQHGLGRNRRA